MAPLSRISGGRGQRGVLGVQSTTPPQTQDIRLFGRPLQQKGGKRALDVRQLAFCRKRGPPNKPETELKHRICQGTELGYHASKGLACLSLCVRFTMVLVTKSSFLLGLEHVCEEGSWNNLELDSRNISLQNTPRPEGWLRGTL